MFCQQKPIGRVRRDARATESIWPTQLSGPEFRTRPFRRRNQHYARWTRSRGSRISRHLRPSGTCPGRGRTQWSSDGPHAPAAARGCTAARSVLSVRVDLDDRVQQREREELEALDAARDQHADRLRPDALDHRAPPQIEPNRAVGQEHRNQLVPGLPGHHIAVRGLEARDRRVVGRISRRRGHGSIAGTRAHGVAGPTLSARRTSRSTGNSEA